MARRRTFKNQSLQEIYDWFREHKPSVATKGKGAAHNAYYVGRYHTDPTRPFAPRGTHAYAAWAAGVDDARDEGTV